jgi:tRNA nucleotidyltransferase (CCA-adding enzyme)
MTTPLTPESIITSHIKADLDALAALVAAGKLYPEACIILPPFQGKREMSYFLARQGQAFTAYSPKDCDLSRVKRLIVVDTRQRERLTHIAEVLNLQNLEIHAYDHHPDSNDDVSAKYSLVRECGSTTTILTHILKEREIFLTKEEATILGLGIYEDTGSFTFNSTTAADLQAGAWLLEQGMDLNVIAEALDNSLTSRQIHILNRMIENAVTHEIHGLSIMVTEIALNEFMDNFSLLAHQLMQMEKVQVLFALGQMGDRVQIVARSKIPDKVDVGKMCVALGGGGHAYAAAASVKDRTITEIKGELFTMLFSAINEEINVASKMTAPAKVLKENDTMSEAEAVMLRYGLKAAPVVAKDSMRCLGILEHQTAARAVSHKLGTQPVSDYMHVGAKTLSPSSSLYPAMDIILSQRQRLVPVVDAEEQVLGVLTRTDIMRLLLDESIRIADGVPSNGAQKDRNVRSLMKDRLPPSYFNFLSTVGALADNLEVSVYAVGGFVRDLLLDRVNLDVDLTVEGDGISFADKLAEQLGGRIREHPKFQTALLIYTDAEGQEQRVDIATSRLEYYEYPGALPTVELSSIKMDLYRRDFTINALAIRLNTAYFGDLVDPFGAQRDMREKNIRILHSLSFVEDPTRVLRAVRFEKRFSFRIAPQSEKLIKNCLQLGLLRNLSGTRLFNELKHIFDEKNPLLCLERMEQLGILADIHPLLRLSPSKKELIAGAEEILSWYKLLFLKEIPENWIVYLLGLCTGIKYVEMSDILTRFIFSERAKTDFLRLREATRNAENQLNQWLKLPERNPLLLYSILIRLPLEGILYIMAQSAFRSVKKEISHFLFRLRYLRLDINGLDILKFGAQRGPDIGIVLRRVLEAKVEGKVDSREEQLALAKEFLIKDDLISTEQQGIDEVISGRT